MTKEHNAIEIINLPIRPGTARPLKRPPLSELADPPKVQNCHRAMQLGAGPHWVAGKRLHDSHTLGRSGGTVWRWKCGSYALEAPRNLVSECNQGRELSKRKRDTLARLKAVKIQLPAIPRY